MILKRRKDQARDGFDIVGITANEITCTDWEALHPGQIADEKILVDPDWQAPFDRIEMENEDAGDQPVEPSPVMMALESLRPRWRQAVELRMDGIKQEEAAEIMGITQPRYYEILHGKDGKSGALGRLRDILIAKGFGTQELRASRSGTRPL